MPSEALEELKTQICAAPEKTESILAGAAVTPPPAKIVAQLPDDRPPVRVGRLRGRSSRDLDANGGEWAVRSARNARSAFPHFVQGLAARCWSKARASLHFVDEMRMEFAIMPRACIRHPDFAEGVRALLIDKTGNAPRLDPRDARRGHRRDGRRLFFSRSPPTQAWTPLNANGE
jgi:enoyl-CoA hydratase